MEASTADSVAGRDANERSSSCGSKGKRNSKMTTATLLLVLPEFMGLAQALGIVDDGENVDGTLEW